MVEIRETLISAIKEDERAKASGRKKPEHVFSFLEKSIPASTLAHSHKTWRD